MSVRRDNTGLHAARGALHRYRQQLVPDRFDRFLASHDIAHARTGGALGGGVIAVSGGSGVRWAADRYGLDLSPGSELQRRFAGDVVAACGVARRELWPAGNCAEARLWMTLVGLHAAPEGVPGQPGRYRVPHPRHTSVWVFRQSRGNPTNLKPDAPCRNCRQWVARVFWLVNGQ